MAYDDSYPVYNNKNVQKKRIYNKNDNMVASVRDGEW